MTRKRKVDSSLAPLNGKSEDPRRTGRAQVVLQDAILAPPFFWSVGYWKIRKRVSKQLTDIHLLA